MSKFFSGIRGFILLILLLLVVASVATWAGVIVGKSYAVTATPGSSGDPVASLSYLNDTFKPALQQEINAAIAAKEAEWQSKLDTAISDLAATVSQNTSVKTDMVTVKASLGMIVQIKQGTQFLVTEGSFTIESGSIVDVTDGKSSTSITALHVYYASGGDVSIKVKSSSATLVIDGAYELKG